MEAKTVGKIISAGATLPRATRIPTIDVGIICKEVAFNTKNIAEEYSASSVLSSRAHAFIPYGVPAPDTPNKLTDKFIETASKVSLSCVKNSLLDTGDNRWETLLVTPLFFQTSIRPSQTE